MRVPRLLMLLLAFSLASPAAHAGGITGIGVGAGWWKQEPGGYVQANGDRADVEDDLRIGSENSAYFWVDFRHPVPVLPRLKLRYTPIGMSGEGTVSRSFSFRGVSLTANQRASSELDADQIDAIIYWTPWSRVFDLDVGLNVKYLDGRVEVENRDTGERHRAAFSGPLPLLYARTEVRLPGTGFHAGGEGSYLAFEGHRVLDVSLGLGYRVGLGVAALGVEGGWKRQRLRLDDFDGLDADLTIEGPYMGISAHF